MRYQFDSFERIFNPKRIAIIGVSAKGFGFGSGIMLSLQAMGYEGRLYPVNPSGGEIAGKTIYRSVAEIPENIDFAIIAVAAQHVPAALETCRQKGAAGAEILSSGFTETGTSEGLALTQQIKAIAAKGMRLLGPNCFGIYCPQSGLTMLPGPDLSRTPGSVAFLSQSGGLAIDFAYLGKWRGITFSKMVSFGNGCDLRETEMLAYLRQDPATRVICLYIEGLDDGRDFFEVLQKTTLEKPVIIMKGGLSDAGNRAVVSHTASMGGSRRIWASVLRQCNAVQVQNMQEMADAALAFSMLPFEVYQGIAAIGGGGAIGVNTADTAEVLGLKTPLLKKELQEKIRPILPQPGSSPANPIDIANPYVSPEILKETIIHVSEAEEIQIHVMIQLLYTYKALAPALGQQELRKIVPFENLVTALSEAKEITGKPIVMVLPNNKQEREALDIEDVIRETRELLLAAGIPVFDQVRNALTAIGFVSGYVRRRQGILKSLQEKAA